MQEEFITELEMEHDYQFRIEFDDEGLADVRSDEPVPVGAGKYPNATRYLSAAVGNCLCASLAFCLRKARAEPQTIRATVRTTLGRNEKGRLRVQRMQVTIRPEVEDLAKLERCLPLFEDFCTVSAAVREGIDIEVSVEPQSN
ncbi:MAG: OsmC-like protein [Methanomassiliicoccales archaeon PtaB.Bin134]|jgi:organic hydroperoxide reductase OsmC/OhrA|nr:MAG: OsmC-like protein [Methanomassiliicoccales archaeon PtaB.Bin134]